jgi:hypothetical protein
MPRGRARHGTAGRPARAAMPVPVARRAPTTAAGAPSPGGRAKSPRHLKAAKHLSARASAVACILQATAESQRIVAPSQRQTASVACPAGWTGAPNKLPMRPPSVNRAAEPARRPPSGAFGARPAQPRKRGRRNSRLYTRRSLAMLARAETQRGTGVALAHRGPQPYHVRSDSCGKKRLQPRGAPSGRQHARHRAPAPFPAPVPNCAA